MTANKGVQGSLHKVSGPLNPDVGHKMKTIQNHSPTGWWIVGILMKNKASASTSYWNNYRIFRGSSWVEAYEKAVANAKLESGDGAPQEFVGISDLLPIYDKFEDGAEVIFQEIDAEGDIPTVYSFDELSKIYENINVQQGGPGYAAQSASSPDP